MNTQRSTSNSSNATTVVHDHSLTWFLGLQVAVAVTMLASIWLSLAS